MNFQDHIFLFVNSSVIWGIIAWGLMRLCRIKLLVLAILLAPYIIAAPFRNIAGMFELIGFYGTSILYGSFGIVAGIMYADYQRAKQYFAKAAKTSFLARGGIALSSLYLITYFGQKIVFNNPMVQFALRFMDGGQQARELVSQVDYDGAVWAVVCIMGSFGVLSFNKYRERKNLKLEHEASTTNEHKKLETL